MKNRRRAAVLFLLCIFPLQLRQLTASQTGARSESFTVSPGDTLKVSAGSGDIDIETSGGEQVLVTVVGLNSASERDLRIIQNGNSVLIDYHPASRHARRVRFEIRIPTRFNLDLDTSGGDISVSGSLTGDVEGRTSGGDIEIDDVDGVVAVKTAGGHIRGGNVGGNATFQTSGGDIEVEQVLGQVELKTAGGDISVGEVGQSLKASTAGGDIELGRVGGDVKASTAGGDIEVAEVSGSAELSTAGGHIRLEGATGKVEASTAGGDLELRGIRGAIRGSTSGGDILAEITPLNRESSSLETAGGDLLLYLPQTAQASIDAVIKVHDDWERGSRQYEIISDFAGDGPVKDATRREIRAQFQINGGGHIIRLRAVHGDIRIRTLQ